MRGNFFPVFVVVLVLVLLPLACGPTPQYELSTSVSPSGGGTVTPSGGTYDAGTEVTITANPTSGYVFDHWGGDATGTSSSVSIVVDSDKNVSAYFTARYTLTTLVSPSGGGTVTPSGGTYDAGTEVTITADAASSYLNFDCWGGDVDGTSSTITINMDGPKTVTAYFGLLFEDDFIDNRNGWSLSSGGDQGGTKMNNEYIEEGELHIIQQDEGAVTRTQSRVDWDFGDFSDCAWEARVAQIDGADTIGYGIVFRNYTFLLASSGFYKFFQVGGESDLVPWTESSRIVTGNAYNVLTVIFRDGDIELYINRHLVYVLPGECFVEGGNTIGWVMGGQGIHIAIDSFKLWSPIAVDSKIAFSALRGNQMEVYVMNADGSRQTRLTNNEADDYLLSWSLDGSKIAFSSDRDGDWEIYVMNADGSNQVNLTNNPANEMYPAWSPDGSKILFASSRDGNSEIYVMDTDGSNQTRLTNNMANDTFQSWSPDGSKIAFSSNRDGNWEIYAMDADGSNQTRLTSNGAEDDFPSWSPDGSKIAFSSDRDGDREIYVMDADGSNQTRLTSNKVGDNSPVWSPDGSEIAFVTFREGDVARIYIMNANGSNQRGFTYPAGGAFLSWSPWLEN
ncbi:Tol-Pal system protein TolB [subsurface metagenome]